jgi:acetate kinase
MQILLLNPGSSSLKFSLFDAAESEPRSLFEGEISGIGTHQAKVTFRDAAGNDLSTALHLEAPPATAHDAQALVARALDDPRVPKIDAIGYRVVHPGPKLRGHQLLSKAVLEDLRHAASFAPLHDPVAVELIEGMRAHFPALQHVVCFDTVFHETLPPEAFTYPLPPEFARAGVHRYGFHGLSCESIVHQLRGSEYGLPKRLAIAHLGGGCSVTAVVDGRSVDTSMGLTPTGGIVMATRPGDLDPGLVLYLLRQPGATVASVETLLNKHSGLAALSGVSGDMREVRQAAAAGDGTAALALRIFTRSVTKALGGLVALLGGLDAIVFAGGIGEHDAASRAEIVAPLRPFGIELDESANSAKADGLRRVGAAARSAQVFVVPAEEDLMIARHTARLSRSAQPTAS